MKSSTIDIVTSFVTLYTDIDEDVMEQISKANPDNADVARATSALRLVRRALGFAIASPIDHLLSSNGSAVREADGLKGSLEELVSISSIPKDRRKDGHVSRNALDVYLTATRLFYLLNEEKKRSLR